MTTKQFLAALKSLGLRLHDCHEYLGIGRSTVFRIANGTSEVPPSVEKLLEMYQRHGLPEP